MPDAPAPGYAPPPADQGFGSAPPPGGYQPAGYPPGPGLVPQGYANNDEKTWALIAHFGGAAGALLGAGGGGWIAPLVAMLAKGNESPTVRAHSVAALNFQITMTIAAIVAWTVGCLLLFIPGFVVWAVAVIFGVIGGMRANEGQLYKYPLTIQLIK